MAGEVFVNDVGQLTDHVGAEIIPPGTWTSQVPEGATAETIPRNVATLVNFGILLSSRLHFTPIMLRKGQQVSGISFFSGTTAAGTPTNQWFCLYSRARELLAVTADDTSTAWAANSQKRLNFASPYLVAYTGPHLVGIMVAATTVPSLVGTADAATMAQTIKALPPVLNGFSTTGLSTPGTAPNPAAALTANNSPGTAYALVH